MGPRKMHKLRSGKYLFMRRFLENEWRVEDQEKGNYDTVDNASIDVVWLSFQTFLREQGYDVNYCSKILLGKLLHQAGVEKVKRGPRNQQKFYYFPLRPVSGSRSEVILSNDCRSRYNTRSFYLNLCKTKPEHYTMSSPSLGNVSVAVLYDRSLSLQKFENGILRRMSAKYANESSTAVTKVPQPDIMKELFPEEDEEDIDYLINKSIDKILGGGRVEVTFSTGEENNHGPSTQQSGVIIEEIPSTSTANIVEEIAPKKKVGRPKGSKSSTKNPCVKKPQMMEKKKVIRRAPKKEKANEKKMKEIIVKKEETLTESNSKPKRKYKKRSKIEKDEAKVHENNVTKVKRKYKPRKKRQLDESEMLESASKCEITYPDFYNHLQLSSLTENNGEFAYDSSVGYCQPFNCNQQADQTQPNPRNEVPPTQQPEKKKRGRPLGSKKRNRKSTPAEESPMKPIKKVKTEKVKTSQEVIPYGSSYPDFFSYYEANDESLTGYNCYANEQSLLYDQTSENVHFSYDQRYGNMTFTHQTDEDMCYSHDQRHVSLLNSTGHTSHADTSYELQTPPSHNFSFYF